MSALDVLIVENDQALGELWSRHLERAGNRVVLRHDQTSAIDALRETSFDVVVLNVLLRGGSAFLISDEVRTQHPETPVIFVNNSGFFADGSIFALSPNARAYVRPDTPVEDLTAMIEHFAKSA
ncbi:MAG: response regulator [Pseudomonadota bacterium]